MPDGVPVIEGDGATIDTDELDFGGGPIHRQRVQLAGTAQDESVAVTTSEPASDAPALATRPVGVLDALGDLVSKANLGQILDAENTKVITSADASPGSPWIGAWVATRDAGIVRLLTVLAATNGAIGGTFTFEFSESGTGALGSAPISETRAIGTFVTVRDFDLINAGAYYRVAFEPNAPLGGDLVFVSTTLRKQDDGAFVRLAGQPIEEANAAMGNIFAFLSAFGTDGISHLLRAVQLEEELVGSEHGLLTRAIVGGEAPDGTWPSQPLSGTAFSYNVPLVADGMVSSGYIPTLGGLYSTIQVNIVTDQPSAAAGVLIEFMDAAATPTVITSRGFTLNQGQVTTGFSRKLSTAFEGFQFTYTNGPVGQGSLDISVQVLTFPENPQGPYGAAISRSNQAVMNRSSLIAATDADDNDLGDIYRTPEGDLKIAIAQHLVETNLATLDLFDTLRVNVPSSAAIPLFSTPFTGQRTILIKNLATEGEIRIAHTAAALATGSSYPLDPRERVVLDVGPGQTPFVRAQDTGELTSNARLDGTTTGGGVTGEANVLDSDDAYATLAAQDDQVTVEGFTSPQTYAEVASVMIGMEVKKSATPATEQVTHVDTLPGLATSGTAVSTTSPVTSNPDHLYLAAVSRRDAAAAVVGVSGLGLSWVEVGDVTGANDHTRTSVWRGVGTPTGDSVVTASFGVAPGTAVIGVSRYSGVDLSNPVDQTETLNQGGQSAAYSDTLPGTNRGVLYWAVGIRRRTHEPGSSGIERLEVATGGTVSDAGIAVVSKQLTATGASAYSGTLNGNVGWSVVAVSLRPRVTDHPVVTLSYEVAGVPGATTLEQTLDTTSDLEFDVDVSGDRAWVFADVSNLKVLATLTTSSSAPALVDKLFVDTVESEPGGTKQLAIIRVARDES